MPLHPSRPPNLNPVSNACLPPNPRCYPRPPRLQQIPQTRSPREGAKNNLNIYLLPKQ